MKELPFVAKIREQGSSLVITLPRPVIQRANLKVGDMPSFSLVLEEMPISQQTPVATNMRTMGLLSSGAKLIPDPFLPEIFHTPQELGLKKKEMSPLVTISAKRFINIRTSRRIIKVTEQIVIKFNAEKFSPLLELVKKGMYNYTPKSNSDLAGICMFRVCLADNERVAELGMKTKIEFCCQGMRKSPDSWFIDLLSRYNKFISHKELPLATNGAKTFLK